MFSLVTCEWFSKSERFAIQHFVISHYVNIKFIFWVPHRLYSFLMKCVSIVTLLLIILWFVFTFLTFDKP
mgnify:FL=1